MTNTNCPSTSQYDSEPKTGQRIVFLDLEGVVVTHKSILATHLPALAGAKIDGFSYDNYLKAQNFLVRDPKPELIFL